MTIAKNYDDGRFGAVLTKIAQGDLVRVPLGGSAASVIFGTSTLSTSTSGQGGSNMDGSGSGRVLTAQPGTSQGVWFEQTLYGRVIGVRFKRDATATSGRFVVIVDGVPHAVRDVNDRRHGYPGLLGNDPESLFLVVDDLVSDGPHTVRISLASDPYGGTVRTLTVYGWLLEASKGYRQYGDVGILSQAGPVAITTAAVSIAVSGYTRKLSFTNTDSSGHTVTLTAPGGLFRTVVVPPAASGGWAEHDFGQPMQLSGWTWKADAAGFVTGISQQGGPRA